MDLFVFIGDIVFDNFFFFEVLVSVRMIFVVLIVVEFMCEINIRCDMLCLRVVDVLVLLSDFKVWRSVCLRYFDTIVDVFVISVDRSDVIYLDFKD